MSQHYIRKSGKWNKRKRHGSKTSLNLLERFNTGSLIKNLLTLGVIAGVFGLFMLAVLFAVYSRDLPDPNQLTSRHVSQSTKIYDRSGENVLYEIHDGEKRTLRKIQEGFCLDDRKLELDEETGIPLLALQATIAAEDHKFCTHKGYSVTGLLRAVIFRGSRGGGSTLTQQLVKNAILSNEHTITRKIKELILSVELERRYSKDEILQIYFNEIPYGSTNYGIESSSRAYFGKSVNELNLAEIATLASLPKAPTTYLNNPDRLTARRNFILDEMHDLGFISDNEFNSALETDSPITFHVTDIVAPHFVFFVKEQLDETYGGRVVEQGGLKVITTIDYEMQLAAEEAVRNGVDEFGESLGFTNASLVAIDPKTGQILAMVGSYDYFNEEIDGSVNVSTRLRQPGSSFKPIVYSAAFDKGYTPNTILWDVNTTFPTDVGDYSPKNYNEKEFGPVTIRQAIQGSLNIPAVKTTYLTGLENAFEFAKKFGYSTFRDLSNYGLSLVLGGAEVKLLEHTNAYATLANDGVRHNIASIMRVEDPDGAVLEEWKESNGEQAIPENIARTTTNVLSDNNARAYIFGTGSYLQLGGRPVAAKTGTTNDARDAWLMGYTPSLAAGVWAGNNDNSVMKGGGGGSSAAGPIWNAFMKAALKDKPVEGFKNPEIPITGKGVLDGLIPSQTVTIDKASGKLATEFTPDSMKDTVTCIDFHSILHFVDVNDPLGSSPKKPERDPQYESWEAAIQDWINRTNSENPEEPPIKRCEAPTENDDIHTKENKPNINLRDINIDNGRNIRAEVTVDARRPISRIEYRLDGQYIASSNRFPYSLNTEAPPSFIQGNHTLSAIAFDDVDNSGFTEASITLGAPTRVAAIGILNPRDNQEIELIQETFSVEIQIRNPERFRAINLFAAPRKTGVREIVGSALNPTSPFINIIWDLPLPGDWILTAIGETNDGQIETTTGMIIHLKEGGLQVVASEEKEDTPTDETKEEETTEETGGDGVVEETPAPDIPTFDPFGFL
ncbi:MAG: transglycosylase domain-containing protein [bacterium]|nr:transglycosylase domain-containing protein [bacterium]